VNEGRGRRVARIAIATGIVLVSAMWIYVLFIGNPENLDKLHDPTFAATAEPICKQSLDELDRLDVRNKVTRNDPFARADLVDTANTELRKMVARLREIPTPNAEDAHAVTGWLADWDQWLSDRSAWSVDLRAGKNVQFTEKQRESTGEPNSKALDDFALVNSMLSCGIPGGI
jgi:hypothetical protein